MASTRVEGPAVYAHASPFMQSIPDTSGRRSSAPPPLEEHVVNMAQERQNVVRDHFAIMPEAQQNLGQTPKARFLRQLQEQVHAQPDVQSCIWLSSRLEISDSRTFGGLWNRAAGVAQMLAKAGVTEGDRVMCVFNFGLDFLDAFLGCVRLGAIAVPVYPPNPAKLQEALAKLALVTADCGAKFGLLDKTVNTLRISTKGWPQDMTWLVPKVDDKAPAFVVGLDQRDDSDVAFLQYTSGSTGEPKGVMLTYENIYANMKLNDAYEPRLLARDAVGCSWLPQFHDMGLLAATLYPLARGRKQVFISPTLYLKNPVLWVEAMSKFHCTWATAPNFGYGLSARKFTELPPQRRPALDLSRVVSLCNAAEPVRLETLREFVAAFSPCGLGNVTLFPSFGLAEHTVLGTSTAVSPAEDPTLSSIMDCSGRWVACGDLERVGEDGKTLLDVRIVVEGAEVEDGEVGEIWMRSASCGAGYWNMEERSRETFEATLARPRGELREVAWAAGRRGGVFMRTGDEGFVERGGPGRVRRLYVCGRIKDVIIVRGKNIYPQDVEATAERAGGGALRLNCSAAVQAASGDGAELEAGDVVCELKATREGEARLSELCERITAAVRGEHSLQIRRLMLIRPRSIPKTTSGKVRRREAAAQLLSGRMERKALVVWQDNALMAPRPAPAKPRPSAPAASPPAPAASELHEQGPPEDLEGFLRVTAEEVAEAAGLAAGEVEVEMALESVGLESLAVASLSQRLAQRLGVEVGPELILNASSIAALAAVLHAQRHPPDAPPSSSPELSAPSLAGHADQPVLPAASGSSRKGWGASWRARVSGEHGGGGGREGDSSTHSAASFGTWSNLLSQRHAEGGMSAGVAEALAGAPGPTASAWSLAVRCGVQAVLIFWLLTSIYLCALPSLLAMERVTDARLFPFELFRSLAEPRPLQPARFSAWGEGNWLALSEWPAPARPLVASRWLGIPLGLLCAAGAFLGTFSVYVVVLKWVLLGRVRAGDYELYGWFYWRRWVVQKHVGVLLHVVVLPLPDAAALSVLYRLLGARIGGRCEALLQGAEVDWDLVEAGARARVSGSALVVTGVVSERRLRLRGVRVGEGSDVGDAAVLCPGVELPPRTRVRTAAVVTQEAVAGAAEGSTLGGNPATVDESAGEFGGRGGLTGSKMLAQPVAWVGCLAVHAFAGLLPVVAVYEEALAGVRLSGLGMAGAAVGLWALFWATFAVATVCSKWVWSWAFVRQREGRGYELGRGGAGAVGRECVHRLERVVGRFVLVHLWGGEGVNWWYRALGARIGAGTLLSMGVGLTDWDAVEIGEGCLLGGGCVLNTSEEDEEGGGRIVVKGAVLGEGVTLGANTVVGPGSVVGKRALVTSMSTVAAGGEVPEHAVVVGERGGQSRKSCYTPRHALPWTAPGAREASLWALHAGWTCVGVWAGVYAVWGLRTAAGLPAMVLCPLGGGVYQLVQLVGVVACKWGVARTAGAGEEELRGVGALWSTYAVLHLWHAYEQSLLAHCVTGGPLANLLLRAMRGRVHLDAYVATLFVYDYEFLEIGPGAALNHLVSVSPHAILSVANARLQHVVVGAGATLWPRAMCIGRTMVPPGTQLGPAGRMSSASTAMVAEEVLGGGAGALKGKMMAGVPASCFVGSGLAELTSGSTSGADGSLLVPRTPAGLGPLGEAADARPLADQV